MQAGKLKHRITLLQPALSQDGFGGFGEPTVFASNVWASITALRGTELNDAQQIVAQVTHLIAIRWQTSIKSNMLVQFGSRVFQIEAVLNPDESTRELRLLCIERNDGNA